MNTYIFLQMYVKSLIASYIPDNQVKQVLTVIYMISIKLYHKMCVQHHILFHNFVSKVHTEINNSIRRRWTINRKGGKSTKK